MDGLDVAESDHAHALRSLNRVNHLLGVDRRRCRCIERLGLPDPSVLDLACGGGGFLAHLARRRRNQPAQLLLGVDRSAFALKCAKSWNPKYIHWIAADANHFPLANKSVDFVSCSLFLHHFDPPEAVAILREAARVARRGVFVDDLVRSRLAWMLTWFASRILSRSWIFHADGPQSVRAAFTPAELLNLARIAGLKGATIKRQFPFRVLLTWLRTNDQVALT